MKRAKPKLLEPVMAVEVVTPEDYLGDVMGNLNSRRGRVEHLEPRGNAQAIKAMVPLVGDVRVRDRPALDDAGSGNVHDAVRSLRGRPAGDRLRARHCRGIEKENRRSNGKAEV